MEALKLELNELNRLINKGIDFTVKDTVIHRRKLFFGLIKHTELVELTRDFHIEEFTLATLDRISSEAIKLAIDEQQLKSDSPIEVAKQYAHKHSETMARIIAIAVLGSERLLPVPVKGGTKWQEDKVRLEELTRLFMRTLKPSDLVHLTSAISVMGNYGDFINSIRLITLVRTAMPNRIEDNEV